MIKSKGIFAVSFIAMMVAGGAYANIASQGYVDQQIGTRAPAGDYATKTELNAKQNASTAVEVAKAGTAVGDATHPIYVNASGVATKIDKVAAAATADKATQDAAGNVITTTYATKTELDAKADADDIPTVNNATLTIQKNGTAVATFTANSATAATANITVPTKTSELSNDSGFITSAATATALGGVKSGGDITVSSTGAVTVNSATKATQDASGNVITTTYATKTELDAKADADDIPTVNNATLTIQKNGTAVDTFTANASANKTINITVPTATSQLTNDSNFITAEELPDGYTLPVATADTLGGVKSGGNITVGSDGAVTVNQAARATTATNDADGNEITETYATKDALTSGLAEKQATLSAAQLNAVNSGITSTKVSTYDGYNAKITAAQTAAEAAQTAAETAQSTATAAQNAINNLDVSTASGSGNVVTSVTQSNGEISVTKGNVQIPVGSATATSYATIWVE